MKLESKTVKNYGNGYVQVEIGSNSLNPKYYKVPETKVDEFTKEYENNRKKTEFINGSIFIGFVAGAVCISSALSKNITKKAMKVLINIASGVAGGIGSMILTDKIEESSHTKLMQKYDAEAVKKN